ncbi:MAG: aminopeptidase P family protein [Salinivirgaceae bacterium]|nr:aminopeptidase P family protein [Salinivirgaceae bacterium]
MFKKETYIKRREKLKKEVGNGLILLLGNSESPMNYADNTYHYRQDSTFLYFTGINHPDLVMLIDCDSGEEILYGDDYTIDHIVWMGQQATIASKAALCGINESQALAKLQAKLDKAKNQSRKIHFLPVYRHDNKIRLFEWLGVHPAKVSDEASLELIKAVINQRNYKSDEEIVEIEKAVNTSVDMHVAAMRMAKPGICESEIAAEMQRIAEAENGHLSFPVIATINGQTLHNHYHGNVIKDGQLFLLDCGAETEMGYAGDLSSTFPVGKTFTPEQKEIFNIALAGHEAAIDMLKPGVEFKEVYYQSARTIMEGMKSMGFVKGNIEDALINGAHAMFFPCGLGHMMGLDVHDMEDLGEVYVGWDGVPKSTQFGLKSLRLGRKLEPGFVLTIEPGIYFIPDLIDLWKKNKTNAEYLNFDMLEKYRNFGGIRNEEDFLITPDGKRLLGKQKPKTIEQVEAERKYAFK